MPLPPSVPREEVHCRRIEMRGYRRTDGMYDIEGRLVDTKSHPFQLDGAPVVVAPGAHHHDMWVRIVVDEDFTVREVHAASDATPYAACGDAPATLQALDANGRPVKIDSCYAYASDREMVRIRWPEHYTGR